MATLCHTPMNLNPLATKWAEMGLPSTETYKV
jgi:hypothetical protein